MKALHRVAAVILCMGIFSGTATAQSEAPASATLSVTSETADSGLRLHISAATPVERLRRTAPPEVLLRFGGPIDATPAKSLAATQPDWVRDVRFGYDTLLLVFQTPVEAEMTRHDDGVTLRIVAKPGTSPSPSGETTDQRQTKLLRAQYLARKGRTEDAIRLLEEMAASDKGNGDALATLGGLQRARGQWIQALETYTAALDRQPRNEFVQNARRRIRESRRPQIRADSEMLFGGDERRLRLDIHGFDYIAARLEAGVRQRTTRARIDNLQRRDGGIADVASTFTRGEVYLTAHRPDGDSLTGSLFASAAGPGLGAHYERPHPDGVTSLRAALLEPSWTFTQSLAQDGTVDRLRLRRSDAWRGIQFDGAAFLRNYRLERDSVAQSLGGVFRPGYPLWQSKPNITLSYNLDAEYPLGVSTETTNAGTGFDPLPLVNREVHNVTLSGQYRFEDESSLNAAVGYSIDRFGSAGPSGSLGARIPLGRDWVLRAQISQALDLTDTQNTTTVMRFGFTWRYGAIPSGELNRLFANTISR